MPTSAFATEQLTVSSTAIGPTAATRGNSGYDNAQQAFVTVENGSIRFLFGGSNPTASVGHLAAAGTSFTVTGQRNVENLKMIRVSTDAVVQITYER